MSPPPVKAAAAELGLPVFQPEKLDAAFRASVRELSPDILVVAAYGKIFGPRFLACFPRGGINLHPSLLPRYRGPCPINAAILGGDPETGITIQSIALEMDAGDIIAQEKIPLTGKETAPALTETAAKKGAEVLARVLDQIAAGTAVYTRQDASLATCCGLLSREQGKINWNDGAVHIERMIRAFDPWPGAWTLFRGEPLRILAAEPLPEPQALDAGGPRPGPGEVLGVDTNRGILIQTQNGLLAVRELQLQSKKAMNFASFINGVRGFTGSVLGDIQ
jgi:methionyl-tRNA formyltransferase